MPPLDATHDDDAPERLAVPFEIKETGLVKADNGSEVGTFEGHASTFGNTDLVRDVIEPGAFAQTLRSNRRVKMLWAHDTFSPPIGKWESLEETQKGLAVKGRLFLGMERARDIHIGMQEREIDSLSIGFRIPKGGAEWDDERSVRRIKRVDLWEISVVNFPANPKATIQRVKALLSDGELPTEREFERLLVRDAGFSRSQAVAIINRGYKALMQSKRDAGGDGARELLESIQRLETTIKG